VDRLHSVDAKTQGGREMSDTPQKDTKTIRKNQMNNMNRLFRLFFALGLLTGAAVTWIIALGLKILI
jgi:hypothetical protein